MSRTRRPAQFLLWLLLLGLAAPAVAAPLATAPAKGPACPPVPGIWNEDVRLPRVAAAIRVRKALTIVAIGGASTAGLHAGAPGLAYPAQLQAILAARLPGVQVKVLNRGRRGDLALAMIARFGSDVAPAHPDLVIWETGTNDAVQQVDVADFEEALDVGVVRLRQLHADIVLMDMQYSPRTDLLIDTGPYADALSRVGDLDGVAVFHRYDLMKTWDDAGIFDFGAGIRGQPAVLIDAVYDCLAHELADMIVESAK